MKTIAKSADKVIADGSASRKVYVDVDDRYVIRKRKYPTDHDYFDDNEEAEIKVTTATGELITLNMKGSDTIGKLKLQIQAKKYIPFDDQEIIFNNMIIKNINTIANVGVKNQSTLTLLRKSVEYMEVYVNIFRGKTVSLWIYTTDTIAYMKSKIKNKEGIPVDEQVLIFNNMVLGDKCTLFDLHIIRKSTITLMSKPRGFKGVMPIVIKTLSGETITQEVKPLDTVEEVKAMIQGKVDIPVDEQELIFNDMVLHDNNTLAECNIKCESTLTLMRISTGIIHIFITKVSGTTFDFYVKPSDTIHNVKSMIHDKEKILPSDQKLIFTGKYMEDSATIADYNISNKSTLTLIIVSN